MSDSIPTIGEIIYRFRKEKGLSQQYLELETGLNLGSISRFESNHINPTKETLLKISSALNLSNREEAYLLGVLTGRVSQQEIDKAILYVTPYLNKSLNPIHISDDTWRFNYCNKFMLELIGISPEFANKFIGKCTLELLFDDNLIIKRHIPKEYWPMIVSSQISHFKREITLWKQEKWFQELLNNLFKLKDFKEIWEKDDSNKTELIPTEKLFIFQDSNQQVLLFHVSDIRIDKYPRINIVEWIPIKKEDLKKYFN